MQNVFIDKLPLNILNKFSLLKQDFIGFNFDFNVFINLVFGFIIAGGLILISILLGKKIRNLLFKKLNFRFNYLIDIAVGYMLISTGVTVLGFFSLLTPPIISLYLLVVLLVSLYPFNNLFILLNKSYIFPGNIIKELAKNKMIFVWVCLFVFLAVINLINPEIREDQYHVDFPKMYLNSHTIMVPPKEQFHVSGSPMLGEMYYTIGIFLWSQESARYIHFLFYLLVILSLYEFSKLNKYKFSLYNLLLLVTAPVIIHETSAMYVDFEWMFCFLISILILTASKKLKLKEIILSGLILGGMLASKMWTIVFIPVSAIYLLILLKNLALTQKFKKMILFILTAAIFPAIWFLRAYLLTGDPIFPAFAVIPRLEFTADNYRLYHYFTINYPILNPFNYLNVFSPLFFLGLLLFLYKFRQNLREVFSLNIFKYLIILFLMYLSVQYPYGRYLLGLYLLFIFFSSLGFSKAMENFKLMKYLVNIFLIFFFLYYLFNSVLVLPYAFGFADKNKYLTRILSRDWSSYYDYGRKFDKYISKNDYVATYGVFGYYYANFKYLDINFVFDPNHKSFELLKKKGFTKIFIKGGDINYFCKQINMKDCSSSHYVLLSSYIPFPSYYLYSLK